MSSSTLIFTFGGQFVAQINKQPKLAPGFQEHEPWLLLHNSGRIERFASHQDAKDEARKSWPKCRLERVRARTTE